MNHPKLLHEGAPWVILVHYRDAALTVRCLESLAKIETIPHGVIIVDHGPDLLPADYWRAFHPNAIAVHDDSNPGFAAGCNNGAGVALSLGAGSLWFLNNDAMLGEPALEALTDCASTCPDVALWGTWQFDGSKKIGIANHKRWFAEASERERKAEKVSGKKNSMWHKRLASLPDAAVLLEPYQSLSGASIFITKRSWEELGPWPDQYFLYWEDAAWCLRAHQLGLPIAMADLKIIHIGSATTVRRSPMSTFYGVRNQLLLYKESSHGAWPGRLLTALYLLQKTIFRRRFNLLKPTWDGITAATRGMSGRDSRY